MALWGRAIVRERLWNCAGAVEDLSVLLEGDPTNADALFLRGDCLVRLKRFSEGVSDFKSALVIKPGDPALQRWLAAALELLSEARH